MHVADFGCGSGFYSMAAAHRVGSRGRVTAIDVQKELLEKLLEQARREHLTNIDVVWGNLDEMGGSKLADESEDAAIVSNVLFQSESKDVLASECARILKPGGSVLIIDWSDSFDHLGPPPEQVLTEETAKSYFMTAGFEFKERFDAGEHHYGLIFKKPV